MACVLLHERSRNEVPMSASPTAEIHNSRYDIDGLLADIEGVPVTLEPVVV